MNRRIFITKGITALTIAAPVAMAQSTHAQDAVSHSSIIKSPSGLGGWLRRMRGAVDPQGLCCLLGPYCHDEKPPDCDILDFPM